MGGCDGGVGWTEEDVDFGGVPLGCVGELEGVAALVDLISR